MNTQATQFYVAIVAICGVVLLAGAALVCSAFGERENQVVNNVLLLLVGGLLNGSGAAIAYLFRLNGKAAARGTGDSVPPG